MAKKQPHRRPAQRIPPKRLLQRTYRNIAALTRAHQFLALLPPSDARRASLHLAKFLALTAGMDTEALRTYVWTERIAFDYACAEAERAVRASHRRARTPNRLRVIRGSKPTVH